MPELYNDGSEHEGLPALPPKMLSFQLLTRICALHHQENRVVFLFKVRQSFGGFMIRTVK
jgi:hypothetical protein